MRDLQYLVWLPQLKSYQNCILAHLPGSEIFSGPGLVGLHPLRLSIGSFLCRKKYKTFLVWAGALSKQQEASLGIWLSIQTLQVWTAACLASKIFMFFIHIRQVPDLPVLCGKVCKEIWLTFIGARLGPSVQWGSPSMQRIHLVFHVFVTRNLMQAFPMQQREKVRDWVGCELGV